MHVQRIERDRRDLVAQVLVAVVQQGPGRRRLAAARFGDEQARPALPGDRAGMNEVQLRIASLHLEDDVFLDVVQQIA